MKIFRKRNKEKRYSLWNDWSVILDEKYDLIQDNESAQLVNKDGSHVIYGSSFVVDSSIKTKDGIEYLGEMEKDGGSHHLSASVRQNNEFLTITVTFLDSSDEDWARTVIKSAHRIAT